MDGAIERPQQQAARVVGVAYLATFALVVSVNFGILNRLIVSGDAAATARGILAHETLFRIGLTGDLLYCAGTVALLTALYVILRPVGRGLALLAAFWRLIWVLMWLAVALNMFDALRLLHGAAYLRAFEPERLQALARFDLGSGYDTYYVGLLFGALGETACGWLWLRSGYIPRWLALACLVTSAWCVACTLIFYVVPGFSRAVNLWWFDTPMALADMVTSVWLIVRGLAPARAVGAGRVALPA